MVVDEQFQVAGVLAYLRVSSTKMRMFIIADVCVCARQIRLHIPNETVLRSIEEDWFEVKRMKEVDKDERG